MGEIAQSIIDGQICDQCCMPLPDSIGIPQTCFECLNYNDGFKKTYVTFGFDHQHVINDIIIDQNCIAVIKCNNAQHGRTLAFELFKTKFCVEYHEDDFNCNMKYFKRGLIYVN